MLDRSGARSGSRGSGCAGMEDYRVQGGILTYHGVITLDKGGVITIEVDQRSGK